MLQGAESSAPFKLLIYEEISYIITNVHLPAGDGTGTPDAYNGKGECTG